MGRWSARHWKTAIDARDDDCATRGTRSIASMLITPSYVPLNVNWIGAESRSPAGCGA
jgi:hypothetical protein